MALGDPYATADELADRIGLTSPTSAETTRLEGAVGTASQEVETFCNRTFNSSGTESQRKFYASSPRAVLTDDFHTEPSDVRVVDLFDRTSTVTTVLVASDWESTPANPQFGRPQWCLKNTSDLVWPVGQQCGHILVTATWGWATVPTAIKEATLLLAEDYFKMKDAPFGVANWGEFGPVRVIVNKRATVLLTQYRRGGHLKVA